VLLIGTGVQAMAHAEALIDYFRVRSFWIAGMDLQLAAPFCEELCLKHPGVDAMPVVSSSLMPTGLGTDVVIALTTSKVPVIPAQLPDETLAIGIGAFRPDMAEIPVELLRKRRVVVDYLKGARHEAGDLLKADLDWNEVSELSRHLDTGSDQRPPSVFKSVGHASWDLAAARVAMQARARR
jgi:1-piperideine-2-carboxylate/1-pyrroline-2-carboxylate reductase [NAD(P)H]